MNSVKNAKIIYEMLASRYKVVTWVFLALIVAAVGFAIPFIFIIISGLYPTMTTDPFQGVGLVWTISCSGLYLSSGFATVLSLSINGHLQDQYQSSRVVTEEMRKRLTDSYKQEA